MESRGFDAFFRSDGHAALKIVSGAVLVALAMLRIGIKNAWSTDELLVGAVMGSMFGATAGTLLCMKDATRRRLDQGLPIGPVNKLLFAGGVWSALLWGLLALGACVVGVMIYAAYCAEHVGQAG